MARAARWFVRALALFGALVLSLLLVRASKAERRPALRPWHRFAPPSEFRARDAERVGDLAGYLELEQRVFAEVERELESVSPDEAPAPISRYAAGGPSDPRTFPTDWNRTYERMPADGGPARGAALLLHGLSDSPYSLRRVGEILAEEGLYVLSLRLPGHGTVPAGLMRARAEDWRAAAALGLQHVAGRAGGGPLWIVGYSTGGTLAVDLACTALADDAAPRPDRLVLISPAMGVTGFAALAGWIAPLARLPWLERLGWESVEIEYDPFKYNSFPLLAGAEVHALAGRVTARVAGLSDDDRRRFPPLFVLQSLVDTTVRTDGIVDDLFARVGSQEDELVLFDVNRSSSVTAFFNREPGELLDRLRSAPRAYALTVVTSASDGSAVFAERHAPGSARAESTSLELAWPPGVFSLSHVALPIPPEDWLYGERRTAEAAEPYGFPLGSIEPRGERALLRVPLQQFMRLRHNPFFPWVETRLRALASAAPR